MGWHKPKKIWHWLALLSPGAVSVAFTAFGYFFMDRASDPGILGMPVALLLCLVAAFLMARGAGSVGKVIGLGLLFAVLLVIVNFSIAFGGCALLPTKFDMK